MAKTRKSGKAKAHAAKAKNHAPKAATKEVLAPDELESTVSAEPAPAAASDSSQKPIIVAAGLRTWNKWLAAVHAIEGLAILVVSATHTFPVTTSFFNLDPVASDIARHPVLAEASKHLFEVNMALVLAICFLLSAVAHAAAASVGRDQYESDLRRGINKIRWVEFGLSTGTILVIVGLLTGVSDLTTLLMIFAFGLIFGAAGLLMDFCRSAGGTVTWLLRGLGALAGIVPWAVFAVYAWGAAVYGSHVPTFVYWIYGTMLVYFCSTIANVYLQYKKQGRWADYLYGERAYMVLSLAAKTALAWQIFAGTLRP